MPEESAKSIGAETTFEEDTQDQDVIRQTLLELSKRVGSRLRAEAVQAKTLTLKFRTAQFQIYSRSITIQEPTDQDAVIYGQALRLLAGLSCANQKARLLGIAGSHLMSSEGSQQLSLFSSEEGSTAQVTKAVDTIRSRFGDEAILPGTLLSKTNTQ